MLLLEADGKRLFREAGITVPRGVRVRESQAVPTLPGQGPWIAKAQVPVGGRGKAGGVLRVEDASGLPAILSTLFGLRIKGCQTTDVLVEEACSGSEHYLSLMVDASAGGIRLIYSPQGGVDIESHAAEGRGFNELLPLDEAALRGAIQRMSERVDLALRPGLKDVGESLLAMFLTHRLMLAEINPLFAREDGSFVAGDAKVVVDMNAVSEASPVRSIATPISRMRSPTSSSAPSMTTPISTGPSAGVLRRAKVRSSAMIAAIRSAFSRRVAA